MEFKDSMSRDDALCEFIRKMTDPKLDIREDHDSLVKELEDIYVMNNEEGVHRHSYARLSHYFYDHEIENEAISVCVENLTALDEYVKGTGNSQLYKSFRKLQDHIDLESIHIGQLRQLQMSVKGANELVSQFPEIASKVHTTENTIKEAQKNVEEYNESVKALNQKINDQTVQSVTILGIFAAVVFAFSGGFSVLSSTLSNISSITGKQTLFFFAASLGIGCILYDVVFALMLFIGRYCDKEPKNIMEFTKILNALILILIFFLMAIYCLCYNGDIRLIPCGK